MAESLGSWRSRLRVRHPRGESMASVLLCNALMPRSLSPEYDMRSLVQVLPKRRRRNSHRRVPHGIVPFRLRSSLPGFVVYPFSSEYGLDLRLHLHLRHSGPDFSEVPLNPLLHHNFQFLRENLLVLFAVLRYANPFSPTPLLVASN